jgi:hypothetical protein
MIATDGRQVILTSANSPAKETQLVEAVELGQRRER